MTQPGAGTLPWLVRRLQPGVSPIVRRTHEADSNAAHLRKRDVADRGLPCPGRATALVASNLGKSSVGTEQLKANAVTVAKITKNAVTPAKIKNGAITGSKVNTGTLGTAPNSAPTDVIKGSKGTRSLGQEATALAYGPLTITVKCEALINTNITARAFISSSTRRRNFTSWKDGSSSFGPATPQGERELNGPEWADSAGPFAFDNPAATGVSASAANGQGFDAFTGLASEREHEHLLVLAQRDDYRLGTALKGGRAERSAPIQTGSLTTPEPLTSIRIGERTQAMRVAMRPGASSSPRVATCCRYQ